MAIITRAEFTKTTLAMPNPPVMKPMDVSTVSSVLVDSIEKKTLTFGT